MHHTKYLQKSKNPQQITVTIQNENTFETFIQEIECNLDDDFQFKHYLHFMLLLISMDSTGKKGLTV